MNVLFRQIDQYVFFEIMTYLDLLDQLHLASTCKRLWKLRPTVIQFIMNGGLCSFVQPNKRKAHLLYCKQLTPHQCPNWRGYVRFMFKSLCMMMEQHQIQLIKCVVRDIWESDVCFQIINCAARDGKVKILDALHNYRSIRTNLSKEQMYVVAATAIIYGERPVIQWLTNKNLLFFGLMRLKRLAWKWMRRTPNHANEFHIIIALLGEAREQNYLLRLNFVETKLK